MKLLFIIDFFYPHVGGVPTLFLNLTKEMVRRGHDVTVLTTHSDKTKNHEVHDGIKIHRLGRNRKEFLSKSVSYVLKSKEKYDLIHTSTYSAMIPAYILSVMKGIPTFLNVHEVWSMKEWMEFTKSKGMFYFTEERILFKLPFSIYACPSEHTKKDLMKLGISPQKIVVIPHGIDREIFNPGMKKFRKYIRGLYKIGDDEIIGCFVGKPTVFKGIEYLLDSIKQVAKMADIRFIFLLSELHKSAYEKFIARISKDPDLKRSIILAKYTGDHRFVGKIIGASDFAVMPSLTEGFGFVAAEAASMGIPIIVTKGTSLTEIISHGKHGVHVNIRDVKDLTEAVASFANLGTRKKFVAAKKFKTWGEVAEDYERIYKRIIKNHREVDK